MSTASSRPFELVRNPYPPLEVLSADQVEQIHDASMSILEGTGMRVADEEARALLRTAGFEVDDTDWRVRFDRAGLLELVAKAVEEGQEDRTEN